MQTATEFMERFFVERTEALRQASALTDAVRDRVLTPTCKFWRSDVVKASEEERIISVSEAGAKTQVISTGRDGRPCRYSLVVVDRSWKVDEVEWSCGVCDGTGFCSERPCRSCGGIGWWGGNR